MGLFRRRPPAPAPAAAGTPAPSWGSEPAPAATPPPVEGEPSQEVLALADFALRHAVTSVVPAGGPLIPFAIVENAEGRRALNRFVGDLFEAQQHARHQVRSAPGVVRAAIAWDGYLTGDGQRQDAVFVEASDRGMPSIIVAHGYRDVPDAAEAVGNPVLVDRSDPLL
jgi:hypothetical protein